MSEHIVAHIDIFVCPACGGRIDAGRDEIRCLQCGNHYEIREGIPLFFVSNEWDKSNRTVTEAVKSFYEHTPFPDYDGIENIGDIVQKARRRRSVFMRLLDEQTPFNIRVLEVGCGTGQLSNFLGIANRFVFGADMCLNSLRLAQDFKKRNSLERVGFYQMNLFRPIFKEESFPLVICNGVLHHTGNPFLGFKVISRLVKRGGYIIIGLYNKYGRIPRDINCILFKFLGEKFMFLDNQLKRREICGHKRHSWLMDQYKNPHESRHSIGEVLRWFKGAGFDFINSVPKMNPFAGFSENERIFKQVSEGDVLTRFLVQTQMLFNGAREGGLFLMIGKRR